MTAKATDSVPANNAVVNAPQVPQTPRRVSFTVEKECIRRFVLKDDGKDILIYHLYPTLADWVGKQLPDKVNPRSHDEQALKSGVAKKIRETILEVPEDFYLANRGVTILAENLKYDPEKGGAPMLLAKGSDFTALKIREIAVANDILLLESPALARSIFYSTDLDQEIPAGLYLAVAQVLAYVYQIRQYRAGKGKRPDPLKDLPIPPDLRRDS